MSAEVSADEARGWSRDIVEGIRQRYEKITCLLQINSRIGWKRVSRPRVLVESRSRLSGGGSHPRCISRGYPIETWTRL